MTVKSFQMTETLVIFFATTTPSGSGGDGKDPPLSFKRDEEAGVIVMLIVSRSPLSSTLTSTSISSHYGESLNEMSCLSEPGLCK